MKPDPTIVLAAGAVTSLSPFFGNYSMIILAALFGGFVALSKEERTTREASAMFLFRAVTISTVMTALAASYVADKTGQPISSLMIPVAFSLAMVGDGWFKVRDWLLAKAKK